MAEGPVYSPTHSFGVDSSRVLEEIMEVVPRSEAVDSLLHKLSGAIRDRKYRMARTLLVDLATQVGEHDPEVTRAQSLLEFMEEDKE
jgi:hypothetical protein